jgi:uncharacterized protein
MLKLVILLGVVLVAVLWFTKGRLYGKRSTKQGADAAPGAYSGNGGTQKTGAATIVACAHCGVHLPQADALNDSAGLAYCGEPHRLAGKR